MMCYVSTDFIPSNISNNLYTNSQVHLVRRLQKRVTSHEHVTDEPGGFGDTLCSESENWLSPARRWIPFFAGKSHGSWKIPLEHIVLPEDFIPVIILFPKKNVRTWFEKSSCFMIFHIPVPMIKNGGSQFGFSRSWFLMLGDQIITIKYPRLVVS